MRDLHHTPTRPRIREYFKSLTPPIIIQANVNVDTSNMTSKKRWRKSVRFGNCTVDRSVLFFLFSLRSHLDVFTFQISLAQTLQNLLCPRSLSFRLFFVWLVVTSYAFHSHCLNTRTTIHHPLSIPFTIQIIPMNNGQ